VNELKPCPFCGDDVEVYEIKPHKHITPLADFMPDFEGAYYIECFKCDFYMADSQKSDLTNKWNRRKE